MGGNLVYTPFITTLSLDCYKIKLIIEKIREGKIENERMRNNFFASLIIDKKSHIYIYTTCNPQRIHIK